MERYYCMETNGNKTIPASKVTNVKGIYMKCFKISGVLDRYSLKRRIFKLFISIFFISTVSLVIFASIISRDAAIQKAVSNSDNKLTLISKQFNTLITSIEYNIKIFSTNTSLLDNIVGNKNDDHGIVSDIDLLFNINDVVFNYISLQRYIEEVRIVLSDGKVYSTLTNSITHDIKTTETMTYQDAIAKRGQLTWYDNHETFNSLNKNDISAITVTKAIIDKSTGNYLGVISLNIREDPILSIYSDISSGHTGKYFIVNRNGIMVSTPDKSVIYSSVKYEPFFKWILNNTGKPKIFRVNNVNTLVISTPLSKIDWYLVSFIPMKELNEESYKIIKVIILIGLACMFVAVIMSFVFIRNITNPVSKLVEFTKKVSEGNFDEEIHLASRDEISTLAWHFNIMIKSIRQLIIKNELEQKKKREYELMLIQSQVNPHFFYNTLDCVRSLIVNNEYEGALDVTVSLGEFYKGVLSKGNDLISISEELNLTVNYLKIQQIIQRNKFDFDVDFDDRIMECNILKLTLQPVVENSIVHGFREANRDGLIHITGKLEFCKIIIEIMDTGKGIENNEIINILNSRDQGKKKSFGLSNINERIKLQFGPEYGIRINSAIGEGTRVTIEIPF